MSLIWMFRGNRKFVFYVEHKFLFDDFEWFVADSTLDDSFEDIIDVVLSCVIAYLCFIVVSYRERSVVGSVVGRGFFVSFPVPASLFRFIFSEREIFLSDCLVVAKWRKLVWEKFSPFSC
jgi:hypothetical protein